MGNMKGWWSITFTISPNENDLEHISRLIREGYTSGEIIHNED